MWTKDYYQEQMLGYLSWVQTEIEQLDQVPIRRNDLDELYNNLEKALERLWELIGASDVDWEGFRYTLEASCDELLRSFNRVLYASSWIFSVRLAFAENQERKSQSWKPAEMLDDAPQGYDYARFGREATPAL